MPRTESQPLPLGTPAPGFRLLDPAGVIHATSDHAAASALLVAFISSRCPLVIGIREAFADLARRNASRGLQVIAVNSNDAAAYPEETAERVAAEARGQGYLFPYLKDEDPSVARALEAACTPDLFLFDADRRLVHHGQFDGLRPRAGAGPSAPRQRGPAVRARRS